MQDFSRLTNHYRVCGEFGCDLTCCEVLSDTCDEETWERLSFGNQNCQEIYDCSAFENKTDITVDEGLPDYTEDLILDFQNPCNSSALVPGVHDFENQDEFLSCFHATRSADSGSWRKEILNEGGSPDFGQGGNTFARCEDNRVELNNCRWSLTDVSSTLHLQLETANSLLIHIIHDHNYSQLHSSSPSQLGQSSEDEEVDQLVPSTQTDENEYSERIMSSCVDHNVPHMLCIEE